MLSCKEITQLISESKDHPLSLSKRVSVRFHLMMCTLCSRYEKQVDFLQDVIQRYGSAEPQPGDPASDNLSNEARTRLKNSLDKESK